MNKAIIRLPIVMGVIGLLITACSPNINSLERLSSATAEVTRPYSTPTVVPTKPVINESFLNEEITEGIALRFWHPWSGEMANLIDEMVGEFNKSNEWGITVEAEFHSDEIVFIDDTNQALEEGNPPDLIAAPSYYLRTLEENGYPLHDLQKFIGSPQWGFPNDLAKSFLPLFWNADISSGKRLGIPAYQSGYLVFYNQTWANELGFSKSPSTPDDFKDQVCKAGSTYLNDNDLKNNGTGGWVYSYNPYTFFSWLNAFKKSEEANEGSSNLGRIENVESGTYLYDLFLDNCAWIGRQQHPYEYFSNRQALAYSGKMEDILTQERVNKLNNSSDQWSVLPYPSMSSKPVLLVDGDSYAILTNDEEKALAAWAFIRWMLNTENQVRMVEESGTFPLSGTAMDLMDGYKISHPAWAEALQYLPFAQNTPVYPGWGLTKEVLADVSWKLIQYTTKRDDIPFIFQDAQNLLAEITR